MARPPPQGSTQNAGLRAGILLGTDSRLASERDEVAEGRSQKTAMTLTPEYSE
jgi:hypothetical protein